MILVFFRETLPSRILYLAKVFLEAFRKGFFKMAAVKKVEVVSYHRSKTHCKREKEIGGENVYCKSDQY